MKFEGVDNSPPRGIKLKWPNEDQAEVYFRVYTHHGYLISQWIGLSGLVLGILSGVSFIASSKKGIDLIIGVCLIILSIAFLILFLRFMQRKVRISISKQAVSINGKHYDRRMWGGFRHGSDITFSRSSTSSTDTTRFGEVVFLYGEKVTETNWLIEQSQTVAYINFLNGCVELVKGPSEPEPVSETGIRKQKF